MSDKKKRPELGEWCMTANEAEKTRRDIDPQRPRYGENYHYVEWKRRFVGWHPAPVKAMYIGWRTKKEGMYWTSGYREDYEQHFECKRSVEVWMFVVDGRSNPIAVFPDDVTWIKDAIS